MTNLYLAIDQGGHASRAIVFDDQAKIHAQAEAAIETFTPTVDRVEHDAEALVKATRDAIAQTIALLGPKSKQIKAAGLATQRSSIVCWNRNSGAPLSPILSWQDRRQAEWLQQFGSHGELIHQRTGLFLSPYYGASKMRWCLDHLPSVRDAAQNGELVIGPLASFLAFRLLCERPLVVDPANASRTLLWNLATGDWDDELCHLFGIPQPLLPRCTKSRTQFGYLEGSQIPLTVMTGDQSAAIFAWGLPDGGSHYANIGTGAFVQHISTDQQLHDRLLNSTAYTDERQQFHTLEGTVNGAARSLHWFAERCGVSNLEQRLPNWLANEQQPPLFINAVSGVGSPFWLAQLESHFIGDGDIPAKACGVVESILFLIQANLDEMPVVKQIIISGGLANLDELCQRLADLSQLAVLRPTQLEATATGLAYLTADRPEHWPGISQTTRFVPQNNPLLAQRYHHWLTEMRSQNDENA